MTRRETIIELARTLRDVSPGPLTGSRNHGRPESFSFELSRLYRAGSYRELEAALALMRRPPSFLGTYMHAGWPLDCLERDFTRRYISRSVKPLPARPRGKTLAVMVNGHWERFRPSESLWCPLGGMYRVDVNGPTLVQVETWHPEVRLERVRLALEWLDENLPGTLRVPDWDKLSERAVA